MYPTLDEASQIADESSKPLFVYESPPPDASSCQELCLVILLSLGTLAKRWFLAPSMLTSEPQLDYHSYHHR